LVSDRVLQEPPGAGNLCPGCAPARVQFRPKPGTRDTSASVRYGELGEPAAKSHWQGFKDRDVAPVLQQRA
jgi:hypothetical protein